MYADGDGSEYTSGSEPENGFVRRLSSAHIFRGRASGRNRSSAHSDTPRESRRSFSKTITSNTSLSSHSADAYLPSQRNSHLSDQSANSGTKRPDLAFDDYDHAQNIDTMIVADDPDGPLYELDAWNSQTEPLSFDQHHADDLFDPEPLTPMSPNNVMGQRLRSLLDVGGRGGIDLGNKFIRQQVEGGVKGLKVVVNALQTADNADRKSASRSSGAELSNSAAREILDNQVYANQVGLNSTRIQDLKRRHRASGPSGDPLDMTLCPEVFFDEPEPAIPLSNKRAPQKDFMSASRLLVAFGLTIPEDERARALQRLRDNLTARDLTSRDFYAAIGSYVLFRFRYTARTFVDMTLFSTFYAILIITSAVVVGLEVEYKLNERSYVIIQYVFSALFVFEIIMRILATPKISMLGSFLLADTVIVLLMVLDCVGVSIVSDSMRPSFMVVLRIFRLMRFFRILRSFPLLRPMRILLKSFYDAIVSSSWSSVFALVLLYVTALSIRMILEDEEVVGNFTSCQSTFLWLANSVLRGFDWSTEIRSETKLDTAVVVFIYMSLLAARFSFSWLTTALFVERMLRLAAMDDEEASLESLAAQTGPTIRKVREALNLDSGGFVTLLDLKYGLQRYPALAGDLGFTEEEIIDLFNTLNEGHRGHVHVDDFIIAVLKKKAVQNGDIQRSMEGLTLEYEGKKIVALLNVPDNNMGSLMEKARILADQMVSLNEHLENMLPEKQEEKVSDWLLALEAKMSSCARVLRSKTVLANTPERLERFDGPLERWSESLSLVGYNALKLNREMDYLRKTALEWAKSLGLDDTLHKGPECTTEEEESSDSDESTLSEESEEELNHNNRRVPIRQRWRMNTNGPMKPIRDKYCSELSDVVGETDMLDV